MNFLIIITILVNVNCSLFRDNVRELVNDQQVKSWRGIPSDPILGEIQWFSHFMEIPKHNFNGKTRIIGFIPPYKDFPFLFCFFFLGNSELYSIDTTYFLPGWQCQLACGFPCSVKSMNPPYPIPRDLVGSQVCCNYSFKNRYLNIFLV